MPRDEPLNPAAEPLVIDVASQAGLALSNAGLIDAIQHDLAEEDVAADRADKGLWPLSEGDDQSCSDLAGR